MRTHKSFQLSWIMVASRALFSLKLSFPSSTSWLAPLVISLLADRLLSNSKVRISHFAFDHVTLLFARLLFQSTLKNREIQIKMWIICSNSSSCLLLNEILLVHLCYHMSIIWCWVCTRWYHWLVNSVLFCLNRLLLSLRATLMNLVLHFNKFLVILRMIELNIFFLVIRKTPKHTIWIMRNEAINHRLLRVLPHLSSIPYHLWKLIYLSKWHWSSIIYVYGRYWAYLFVVLPTRFFLHLLLSVFFKGQL